MIYQAVFKSPVGTLGIFTSNQTLLRIEFLKQEMQEFCSTSFAETVCQQLQCYFDNSEFRFNLNLAPSGTPYQKRVWSALQEIAPGVSLSYGELATLLHSSPRAIGNACRCNPIPIIIPCHRVLAKNGMGGYTGEVQGQAMGIKRWLLVHEGALSPELAII